MPGPVVRGVPSKYPRADRGRQALQQGQDPNDPRFRQQGAGPLHLASQGVQSTSEAARLRKAEAVRLLIEYVEEQRQSSARRKISSLLDGSLRRVCTQYRQVRS